MEKSGQRKIFELARKLETFQRKLAKRTPEEKLESLVRKLSLADFDDWEASFRDLVAYLRSTVGSASNPLDWVSHISLQTDTDRYNHRAEKVALLTMHAAKGLEFPVVFVTGCEDNLIPLRLPGRDENHSDEERRLFYVAMTRAKERLYLTYCRKRTIFGQSKTRLPSPYLIDIENRLKSHDNLSSKHHRKKGPEQLDLF
jgi:superfamily I DNA/RNA helicase